MNYNDYVTVNYAMALNFLYYNNIYQILLKLPILNPLKMYSVMPAILIIIKIIKRKICHLYDIHYISAILSPIKASDDNIIMLIKIRSMRIMRVLFYKPN